ncbi:hypothetical protein CYMTET_15365 [Cymbomonas tetramitiformis]|uniref:non-specific serine/threonine protein kinase n=1 Tax=Cymbomonas tetramitiformis TaxID=36881 RepID=A0AAE0GE49_9CHLO|nr:hypothetical protein CYMTET_15365 [Cymbomonas tetramitiformis]
MEDPCNLLQIIPPYAQNNFENPISSEWDAIRHAAETAGGSLGLESYKHVKKLQTGAFGSVQVVQLNGSKFQFALKQVNICSSSQTTWAEDAPGKENADIKVNPQLVQRAAQELKVLEKAFACPYVITAYDAFLSPCRSCFNIVSELCREDMCDLLSQLKPGRLPEDLVRIYAAEVLLALEELHRLGFVYRDLKLENVLIRDNKHIVLSDFDLSLDWNPKVTEEGKKTGENNKMFGTMDYLAPEVIQGAPHGPTADFWAFGVLIYEMLYGSRPFAAWSQERTFYNITTRHIELPETPTVSDEAQSLLRGLFKRCGPGPVTNVSARLGWGPSGAQNIREHEFFESIDFDALDAVDVASMYEQLPRKPKASTQATT